MTLETGEMKIAMSSHVEKKNSSVCATYRLHLIDLSLVLDDGTVELFLL